MSDKQSLVSSARNQLFFSDFLLSSDLLPFFWLSFAFASSGDDELLNADSLMCFKADDVG